MNDRRHELEKNELAVQLERVNKTIEPYSRLIAVVVGVLIVAALGWLFYVTKQGEQRSDATLGLLQASASGDPEALGQVSESYPGTLAAAWARVYQGNEFLGQGIQALYNDRENAVQLLGDAKNSFSNALASQRDPLLQSRAHFGLARVAESMGDLDEAIKQYQETIAVGESEAMTKKAQSRINSLSSPSTKQFLAWFADQDFSPADPSMPPSLPGADTLPDLPDLDLGPLQLEDTITLPGGEDSDVMEKDSELELPADTEEDSEVETGEESSAAE
jgi:tetratricopeptide (TPR) repeat protein